MPYVTRRINIALKGFYSFLYPLLIQYCALSPFPQVPFYYCPAIGLVRGLHSVGLLVNTSSHPAYETSPLSSRTNHPDYLRRKDGKSVIF